MQTPTSTIATRTRNILLVEPGYKTKYPPLGLMKISTFHKNKGDNVVFVKGNDKGIRDKYWDIIYITTLFTYQWKVTIDTIKFYQRGKASRNIKVGGILASLLCEDLVNETGIIPHFGLWKEVDTLPPDYGLVKEYNYTTSNASLGYTTKGCINHCPFCAVPELEPNFVSYIPLRHQIDETKKDLILLDNNVLASQEFSNIISDIKQCGFAKDARFRGAKRYIDFNQGMDARLLTEEKMYLLSQIALKPLRIAFDDIKLERIYTEKIRLAKKYGITHLSNYILFNFNDGPDDFYRRLRINVELNESLGLSIFSFPMRYIPLDLKHRKYTGPGWTETQLRGVQCILHATHGVVGPKLKFFEVAFGKNEDEFRHIIGHSESEIFHRELMPKFVETSVPEAV